MPELSGPTESVLVGSQVVPMAPIQILTNNLLYDFSQVPIPTDDVDPELVARPRPWSMSDLTRFILFIGPCGTRRRAAVSPYPRSR